MPERVLLVGCGKMGSSLLEGWVEQGFEIANLAVVEPNTTVIAKFAARGILIVESIVSLPKDFRPDVVIFAVKPQVMGEVVPSYAELNTIDTAFMSIAAGKTISEFEKSLGASAAIVRAMPNTPAAVGLLASLYNYPNVSRVLRWRVRGNFCINRKNQHQRFVKMSLVLEERRRKRCRY